MTVRPKTVQPSTPVKSAADILQAGGFHHLPVVDADDILQGIVTDRDIRSAVGYDASAHANLLVEEIMTHHPVSVSPKATLEEAITTLHKQRFGALPIVDEQKVVGIITRHDILKAFQDLLGLDRAGSRIEVAIPNGSQDIAVAMHALSDEDEVYSLVAARLRQDGAEPVLYIRTGTVNPWRIEKKLRGSGLILLAPETPEKSS